jgi:hypothetical protein
MNNCKLYGLTEIVNVEWIKQKKNRSTIKKV